MTRVYRDFVRLKPRQKLSNSKPTRGAPPPRSQPGESDVQTLESESRFFRAPIGPSSEF